MGIAEQEEKMQGLTTCRENLWTERSLEQKVEVLRWHVMNLLETIEKLRGNAHDHDVLFRHHDHIHGKVFCAIGERSVESHARFFVPMNMRDKE